LVPSLILGSSKSGALLLALFFSQNQLIFPPKQVPCRFSLNLPLFGLGPQQWALPEIKPCFDQFSATLMEQIVALV